MSLTKVASSKTLGSLLRFSKQCVFNHNVRSFNSSKYIYSANTEKNPAEDKVKEPEAEPNFQEINKQLSEENNGLLEKIKATDVHKTSRLSAMNKAVSSQVKLLKEGIQVFYPDRIWKDKYKRALAENENIRQRMIKQVSEAKVFGIQSFSKDMLEVADILDRAKESIPQEAVQKGDNMLKGLYEGITMTDAQLQSVFKRHSVNKINPIGEKFNSDFHQSMFEAEDPEKEPGTVIQVLNVGYKIQDRIIRPAKVGIVKKPSK